MQMDLLSLGKMVLFFLQVHLEISGDTFLNLKVDKQKRFIVVLLLCCCCPTRDIGVKYSVIFPL